MTFPLLSLGTAFATLTALATPASAYPVDCAILLCLAGGWPASLECGQARAVFIARITPWPVEPPLQIWNCPMHASTVRTRRIEQLFEVALRPKSLPPLSLKPAAPPALLPVADQADVDISDPAYDFVRSIHVYQTEFSQHRGHDDNCTRTAYVQLGTYGAQGDYTWARSSIDALPDASGLRVPGNCNDYRYRSVFVDRRDYAGTYGFEEVNY